ncbi:MAG: hypothetical protein WBQ73_03110 [Candidatus Babeliales bacterium]
MINYTNLLSWVLLVATCCHTIHSAQPKSKKHKKNPLHKTESQLSSTNQDDNDFDNITCDQDNQTDLLSPKTSNNDIPLSLIAHAGSSTNVPEQPGFKPFKTKTYMFSQWTTVASSWEIFIARVRNIHKKNEIEKYPDIGQEVLNQVTLLQEQHQKHIKATPELESPYAKAAWNDLDAITSIPTTQLIPTSMPILTLLVKEHKNFEILSIKANEKLQKETILEAQKNLQTLHLKKQNLDQEFHKKFNQINNKQEFQHKCIDYQ